MSTLALPQARIPLGYAMVGGQRVPVEIDIEWMRALTVLVQRTGGTSGNTSAGSALDDLLPLLMTPQASDPVAQEAIRAIDELRNELSSAKTEVQSLRGQIEDALAHLAEVRPSVDLMGRITQIEDRLQ